VSAIRHGVIATKGIASEMSVMASTVPAGRGGVQVAGTGQFGIESRLGTWARAIEMEYRAEARKIRDRGCTSRIADLPKIRFNHYA
jgi:hypothetical protein